MEGITVTVCWHYSLFPFVDASLWIHFFLNMIVCQIEQDCVSYFFVPPFLCTYKSQFKKEERHIKVQWKQLMCPWHHIQCSQEDVGVSSKAVSHISLSCLSPVIFHCTVHHPTKMNWKKWSLSEAPKDGKTITTYGKNVTLSITQVTLNNIIQMEDISGLNIAMQTVNTVGCTAERSWGAVKVLLPCKFKGLALTWRNRGTHWDTEHKATEACKDLTTKDELL